MYALEGLSSVANFMKSLNKTETATYYSVVCSSFPKAIVLTFIRKGLARG